MWTSILVNLNQSFACAVPAGGKAAPGSPGPATGPAASDAPASTSADAGQQASAAEAPAPPADTSEESARLVALDMALSGTPREETDRYLAEHFDVPDREALLDEVYATVGG